MSRAGRKTRTSSKVTMPAPLASLADHGPRTRAQRLMCISEPASDIDPTTGEQSPNPNGSTRKRRLSVLEWMGRKGALTNAQVQAGLRLQEAFEAVQRGPAAIKEIQVDSSPKPDANTGILIDRMSKLVAVSMGVPRASLSVVDHVVLCNQHLAGMPGPRGMDAVARNLNLLRSGLTKLDRHIAG